MSQYAIELRDICKKFGEFYANKNINLKVKRGEVHALVGENGAGKSTLMNILFGLYTPTSGTIKINGKLLQNYDATLATNIGIGMVHQHFKLVEALTVLDNIMLGHEINDDYILDLSKEIYDLKLNYLDSWFDLSTKGYIEGSKINKLILNKYQKIIENKRKLLIRNIKKIKKEILKFKKYKFQKFCKNIDIKILNSFKYLINVYIFKLFKKSKSINYTKYRQTNEFAKEKINIMKDDSEFIKKTFNEIEDLKVNLTSERLCYKFAFNKLFKLEKKFSKSKVKISNYKNKLDTTFFLDQNIALEKILEISDKYKLDIDPYAKIKNISVGMQQRVEILKILYRKSEILILDEPTAMLSPNEIEGLLDIIKLFKKQGKTIIIITHKLSEVQSIADNCTIIRKGEYISTVNPNEFSIDKLAEMMVGTKIIKENTKIDFNDNKNILSIANLGLNKNDNKKISFDLKKGEILGIAGIEGNGQIELANAILRLRKIQSGNIILNKEIVISNMRDYRNNKSIIKKIQDFKIYNKNLELLNIDKKSEIKIKELLNKHEFLIMTGFLNITKSNVSFILKNGLSYIPENRLKDGIIGEMNLLENSTFNTFYRKEISNWGFISFKKQMKLTEEILNKFDVRVGGEREKTYIKSLSGGNQQKFVIGREILRNPKVIIAVQPSRGLDIGAINLVHKILIEERNKGNSIILISYELDEIIEISDRIAVMYGGKIMDIMKNKNLPKEKIGQLMVGVKNE